MDFINSKILYSLKKIASMKHNNAGRSDTSLRVENANMEELISVEDIFKGYRVILVRIWYVLNTNNNLKLSSFEICIHISLGVIVTDV